MLFTPPNVRATDSNNLLLSGAQWYFYATGTTTLQPVYTTSALSTPHANPVVADAGGAFPPIYLDPTKTYRAVLKTAAGATVPNGDIDPAGPPSSGDMQFDPGIAASVKRSVALKLRETPSLQDFGGAGDNATDCTSAVSAALAYIAATGNPVFVPPGTYLTDPFQIAPQAFGSQGFFYGLEGASTVVKRRTDGAGAFVTVGSASGTIFQANLIFAGITIDGGAITNGDTCVLYDVVRSRFDSVIFNGGAKSLHSYGGIALTFADCTFQNAARGLVAEKFTSSAGGGYPNLLRLDNCRIVDNREWGIWFDYGRMLIVTGGQIEQNGTTLAAAQGGIYIGPNISEEVSINDSESLGLLLDGTWFEANKGVADIHLNSGMNVINDVNLFSTSTQTTNDIKIDGGRYVVRGANSSFSKTANLIEGAGAGTGNRIEFVEMAALSYSATKTSLFNGAVSLSNALSLFPAASATPGTNGQMTFELTNDTTLKIKVKGSDGTVRSNSLTLS